MHMYQDKENIYLPHPPPPPPPPPLEKEGHIALHVLVGLTVCPYVGFP